jgi:hypothetical protein
VHDERRAGAGDVDAVLEAVLLRVRRTEGVPVGHLVDGHDPGGASRGHPGRVEQIGVVVRSVGHQASEAEPQQATGRRGVVVPAVLHGQGRVAPVGRVDSERVRGVRPRVVVVVGVVQVGSAVRVGVRRHVRRGARVCVVVDLVGVREAVVVLVDVRVVGAAAGEVLRLEDDHVVGEEGRRPDRAREGVGVALSRHVQRQVHG